MIADQIAARMTEKREALLEACKDANVSREVMAWRCGLAAGVAHSGLAVVDAVLNLHVPVDRGRVMPCCEGCESVNGEFHEDCCHEWPCPTIEAIAGTL